MRRAWRSGQFALLLACGSACQSYEARPLEPELHRAAWHARNLGAAALAHFLEGARAREDARAEAFDPSDGLSLEEGRLVALVFNPELRLARARLGLALGAAQTAGLWMDPELSVSVLRISEQVPDPWVIGTGASVSIPLSDRLEAEVDAAESALRVARLRLQETEWQVRRELGQAWFEWSAARQRVEQNRRLIEALDGLVQTSSDLAREGELARTEAALFLVEREQRRNRLRRLEGEVRAREQGLHALLGLAPEAPVELVAAGRHAALGADAPARTERLFAHNPALVRLREEYELAEARLRQEVQEQYPDLRLGPLFESEEGITRLGLTGALPLPVWNANKRAIAEARALRELARAACETEYERLVGRLSVAGARASALAEQRDELERVLVPLVEAQLEDAARLLQMGEGGGLVLLESLVRAHETRMELIESELDEAVASEELLFLLGPEPAERASEEQEEAR